MNELRPQNRPELVATGTTGSFVTPAMAATPG